MDNKPTPAEVTQLRAEMRRRKILERGDERMRKLFKESRDETNQLTRGESIDERNRNLMEEIIKNPKVMERISSIDNDPEANGRSAQNDITANAISNGTTNLNDLRRSDDDARHVTTHNKDENKSDQHIDSSSPPPNKPLIDLSYFEKLEKKQKLKQQKLELSKLELLLINLVNILTMKRDVILVNLFKILFACLCSYLCLNIVTPFIISQSIAIFYTDLLNQESQFSFKLLYNFIKSTLLDSLSFVFCYTVIQTFLLE